MKKHILLVEDDLDIAELVQLHLNDGGYKTTMVHDGLQAWQYLQKTSFDLLVLDVMLPGLDGLEICKRCRSQERPFIPILMLTSKSSELDRVLGLELGADDYLTKPFSLLELLARVKALLRRSDALTQQKEDIQQFLEFQRLTINQNKREVFRDKQLIELTVKEFDLLFYFAQHPGQVFSRMQLLDNIWWYSHEGYEHTVNSHINRLRIKLEPDPHQPTFIKTVWGVGYQFIAE